MTEAATPTWQERKAAEKAASQAELDGFVADFLRECVTVTPHFTADEIEEDSSVDLTFEGGQEEPTFDYVGQRSQCTITVTPKTAVHRAVYELLTWEARFQPSSLPSPLLPVPQSLPERNYGWDAGRANGSREASLYSGYVGWINGDSSDHAVSLSSLEKIMRESRDDRAPEECSAFCDGCTQCGYPAGRSFACRCLEPLECACMREFSWDSGTGRADSQDAIVLVGLLNVIAERELDRERVLSLDLETGEYIGHVDPEHYTWVDGSAAYSNRVGGLGHSEYHAYRVTLSEDMRTALLTGDAYEDAIYWIEQ